MKSPRATEAIHERRSNMAKQKKKQRCFPRTALDEQKLVNFSLDVLANVIAAILAEIIHKLLNL